MAKVTQEVQSNPAPNYLGYAQSQPGERQALLMSGDTGQADVFNTLAKGITGGFKMADDAIKTSLKQDVTAALTPIVDEAGGNVSPDEMPAIAGTGARGAKFAAAGPSGVGLDELTPDNVPAGIATAKSGLSRMQAAYQAGHLSQSYFDAQVAQVSKRLRDQYPGYEAEVDQLVHGMYGVQTANQVRQDVLRDMISQQIASQSSANKLQTRYETDRQYINYLHPDMDFNAYKQNPDSVDLEVGRLKAQVFSNEMQSKDLDLKIKAGNYDKSQVSDAFADRAQQYVNTTLSSQLTLLRKSAIALNSQTNPDPAAVTDLANQIKNLRAVASAHLDEMALTPLQQGSSNTWSNSGDPAKLASSKSQALAAFDALDSLLGVKDVGAFNSAANIMKMQSSQDQLKLAQRVPQMRVYEAISKSSPQLAGQVMQLSQGAGLEPITKSVLDTSWLGGVANPDPTTGPMPAASVAGNVLAAKPANPGKAVQTAFEGLKQMAQDKDPKIAFNAVQSLYKDSTYFAQFSQGQKVAAYTMLGSPDFTQKMVQLGKTNPVAFDMYSNWMERNAPAAFKEGIDNLQSAGTFDRYNVTFDPKTFNFTAQSVTPDKYQKAGYPDPAGAYVQQVNRLATSLKPVLEAKYGDQAPAHFLSILEANGYNPNAPKQGTWVDGLGNAMVKAFSGAAESEGKANQGLIDDAAKSYQQLKDTQGKMTGKQSSLTLEDKVQTAATPTDTAGRFRMAYDYFSGQGWSREQSAGIIGSLAGESGTMNTKESHDNGVGIGIAGWNGSRRAALMTFAKENNADPYDLHTQLAFVNHELNTTEKAAGDRIRAASSPEEAAAIFTHLYERPSIPRTRARMNNAIGFYEAFNKTASK